MASAEDHFPVPMSLKLRKGRYHLYIAVQQMILAVGNALLAAVLANL